MLASTAGDLIQWRLLEITLWLLSGPGQLDGLETGILCRSLKIGYPANTMFGAI